MGATEHQDHSFALNNAILPYHYYVSIVKWRKEVYKNTQNETIVILSSPFTGMNIKRI
jgi:hypothetical protein